MVRGQLPALPLMVGFRQEILPILLLWLGLAIVGYILSGAELLFVLALWASVTTIMLWPVGRRLGQPYRSYRRPAFILGVLSMAALPGLGFFLEYLPPTSHHVPYVPRTWVLLAVVAIITVFSLVAASRRAIGKPLGMFFRPDLLFGDGRVLGTGLIALGLSMRFLFADVPETFPHLPAPKGNWWGLFFAIAFGLIQIIPLRSMLKLRMRLARIAFDRWTGWGAVILKEGYLVLASLVLLFGFHNVFKGTIPLLQPSLAGLEAEHFAEAGLPGLISTGLAALFIIFVRGGYKKSIGDPFIKETLSKSIVKQVLFLIGFIWLFYSFAHVMEEQPFGNGPTTLWPPALIGWALFAWGVLMLGPFRIWAQRNQGVAIVRQMAAVILPSQPADVRKRALLKIMMALAECPEGQRRRYMQAMQEALAEAPTEVRETMTALRMECLSEISSAQRRILMKTMDTLMAGAQM